MSSRFRLLTTAAFLISWMCVPTLFADGAEKEGEEPATLRQALQDGDVKVSLRYRFETVDEDGFADSAEASTLRTSLSYFSKDWKGWSVFVEAENVATVGNEDDYNNVGAGSSRNDGQGLPVVADPADTELNQAGLRYRAERWSLTLGRQEINLGDQRFVGAVAWRQNHQSFDAVRLEVKPSSRWSLDYSYLTDVHRIFGDSLEMSSHLLNVPVQLAKGHQLTAYGYVLDYDDASLLSTSTYGLEYKGKIPVSDGFALRLELEAAEQADSGDNPLEVDTDYLLASVGGDVGPVGIDVTWEVLGERGDGARSFQTPLATLHKWNGWADKFLQTPPTGLETLYLRLHGKLGKSWRYMISRQEFTSDALSIDYGTELDAELVYTSPWKQVFALKYADYDADDFARDTEKVMVWSSYAF